MAPRFSSFRLLLLSVPSSNARSSIRCTHECNLQMSWLPLHGMPKKCMASFISVSLCRPLFHLILHVHISNRCIFMRVCCNEKFPTRCHVDVDPGHLLQLKNSNSIWTWRPYKCNAAWVCYFIFKHLSSQKLHNKWRKTSKLMLIIPQEWLGKDQKQIWAAWRDRNQWPFHHHRFQYFSVHIFRNIMHIV